MWLLVSHTQAWLIFGKGAKVIERRDRFLNRGRWGNWIATGEKMTLDLNLTPYAKINP